MKLNELALIGVAAATIVSCSPAKKEYASYELYPVRSGDLTEMEYTPKLQILLCGHPLPMKCV